MTALPTTAQTAILRRQLYQERVLSTRRESLIAYWPLGERNGTTAFDISGNVRNGTHTGVDLANAGIGDGSAAPYFDGVNDFCNIYSAGLSSAFTPAEFSFAGWARIFSSSVWGDSVTRRVVMLFADNNNNFVINKDNGGYFRFSYIAGGTVSAYNHSSPTFQPVTWTHLAVSISKSGDFARWYINGVLVNSNSGLGTWVGSLVSTQTIIGATSTSALNIFNGWLSHVAFWSTPLTSAEIAALGRGAV